MFFFFLCSESYEYFNFALLPALIKLFIAHAPKTSKEKKTFIIFSFRLPLDWIRLITLVAFWMFFLCIMSTTGDEQIIIEFWFSFFENSTTMLPKFSQDF